MSSFWYFLTFKVQSSGGSGVGGRIMNIKPLGNVPIIHDFPARHFVSRRFSRHYIVESVPIRHDTTLQLCVVDRVESTFGVVECQKLEHSRDLKPAQNLFPKSYLKTITLILIHVM